MISTKLLKLIKVLLKFAPFYKNRYIVPEVLKGQFSDEEIDSGAYKMLLKFSLLIGITLPKPVRLPALPRDP